MDYPSGNHFSNFYNIIVREKLSMDADKNKEQGQYLQKGSILLQHKHS